MNFAKGKYLLCLLIITCSLFINVNRVSREPYSGWNDSHFKDPHQQICNVALAHSLYFYNIFPIYLEPIIKYCEDNIDYALPLASSPFYSDKLKKDIKDYKKEDIFFYPPITDLGMVFIIYLTSVLHGQFFPIGVRMMNILIFLIILLYVFHRFYRQGMTLAGLLICSFLAAHSYFMCHLYYYSFTGWGYPLLGSLLIFAIFLPIVTNEPMSENKLWLRIIFAGIAFFVFMVIRSDIFFIFLSILFFILIYGDASMHKRVIRTVVTLLILVIPYFVYSNLVTHLRHYYHSKYNFLPTQINYNGAHHYIWHGVYCGLGDFGEDKGFKWLDSNAEDFVKTIKPGIEREDVEYEIILREKVLSTIQKNPAWYMKILLKRVKRIFWCGYEDEIFPHGGGKKYHLWGSLVFKASLVIFIILCILFKKYKELKMYLFFIPTIFVGLFITTAAGARYYYAVLMLYCMPLVFVIKIVIGSLLDQKRIKGLK